MNYMRHLDAETKGKLRAAKKKAAQESKADRLKRARELLAAKETALRKPRERDNAHLQYVRRCPCLPCVILGERQEGPTRAMHVRSGYPEAGWSPTGMAQKPDDWRSLPGFDRHHTDGPKAQHKMNERAFWEALGVYPPLVCGRLRTARENGEEPADVIHEIASARNHVVVTSGQK